MAKMVQFVNPFKEKFTWTWNSEPYTFIPGKNYYMEDWKAKHFAKHLVDRELLANGKMVNDQTRDALLKKCIHDDEEEGSEEVSEEKLAFEILNRNKAAKAPKAKKGAKAKTEEKPESDEEAFEGLAE